MTCQTLKKPVQNMMVGRKNNNKKLLRSYSLRHHTHLSLLHRSQMCVCLFVYCLCLFVCLSMHNCIFTYECVYVCSQLCHSAYLLGVSDYQNLSAFMCICVSVYIYMCVCVCVLPCICICVCVCVFVCKW